jgi:hypothetical protein
VPATVLVNAMTVVHKDSGGMSMAMPDVCNTPSPAGPIPLPYPNIAMSSDTAAGSSSVAMDGNPIMIASSYFATSTGDEAGSGGGVVSGQIKGKAYPKLYSFDVKVEGEGVFRLGDIMLHNGGSPTNTPPATEVQPPGPPATGVTSKDPEIPEVTSMKWDTEKAACGDIVTYEVETKNLGTEKLAINALRKPGDAAHEMNAYFFVPISGDKGSFKWTTRRGRYEQTVKLTGEQVAYKGPKLSSNALELKTAPDAKETKIFQRSTPQYKQQLVGGAKVWLPTGVNYGWSVAYDVEIKSGRFSVTRKIDFNFIGGASASGKQRKKWKAEIESVWDKQFKIHRKDCKRGDKCDCPADQGCCAFAIRIVCEWAGGQGKQVDLHKGANQASGWGTALWWYSHTWWEVPAGVPATVRAHEFGHQIGAYDEYPEGACDPARAYTNVKSSVMSSGSFVYDRHFQDFHDWFKSKAAGELGDTVLLRM